MSFVILGVYAGRMRCGEVGPMAWRWDEFMNAFEGAGGELVRWCACKLSIEYL